MINWMTYLQKGNRWFFFLIGFYLIFRLSNLTLLPIFNDEAIYLDWGWKETHIPGNLYYSLFDAKQPFLMWIFGIAQNFFSDPLFAGRLVSVICGLLTLIGIYNISKKLFDARVALLASLLYIFIPLFSFYDRQTLMESAIGTVGIWFIYTSLLFFEKTTIKYAISLGIILGVGYFIKSNTLLFLMSYLVVLCLYSTRRFTIFDRDSSHDRMTRKNHLFLYSFYMLLVMLAVDSLFLINPMFWQTLSTNSRYSLTLSDLFHFPVGLWLTNLLGNAEIIFIYLTPLVTLSAIWGGWRMYKTNQHLHRSALFLCLIPLILETLLTRVPSQRYVVSFLPLVVVLAGFGMIEILSTLTLLLSLKERGKPGVKLVSLTLILAPPLFLCLLEITNPLGYFSLLNHITRYSSYDEYVSNWTSGYGVKEAVNSIQERANNNTIVFVRADFGNPEDAIFDYFQTHSPIPVRYVNFTCDQIRKIPSDQFAQLQLFFVSRGTQYVGNETCLKKLALFPKPYGSEFVGVYQLVQMSTK